MTPPPMADTAVLIRPYEPRDRSAVRQICCDTADRGSSVEHFFRDREVFADVLMNYYTDHEPKALWVAEHAGQVIGYLAGCLDSRRYGWVMTWHVVPHTMMKAARRGTLLSRDSLKLCWAGFQTWWRGGWLKQAPLNRYPTHLHINLQGSFRGQGIGRRLIQQFLEQACASGRQGIHVSVRADNPPSCRFFEQMGFTELDRCLVTLPMNGSYGVHETVIYGRSI